MPVISFSGRLTMMWGCSEMLLLIIKLSLEKTYDYINIDRYFLQCVTFASVLDHATELKGDKFFVEKSKDHSRFLCQFIYES